MFQTLKRTNRLLSAIIINASWSIVGAILSKLVLFVSYIFIANYLGKIGYGKFGILNSTLLMFVAIASLSLGATATKYIAEYRDRNPIRTVEVILITQLFSYFVAFCASFLIFFFAKEISLQSFGSYELVIELKITTFILFFSVINMAQNGILAGFERFDFVAYSNIVKSVLQACLMIIGVIYFDLKGVFYAIFIAQVLSNLYNVYLIRKLVRKLGVEVIDVFKKLSFTKFDVLWKFSFPATVSSLLIIPFMWYTKSQLAILSGFQASASYDVAEQWRAQLLFIPSVLAQIVLPMLANLKETVSKQDFIKSIKLNLLLNLIVTTCLIGILFWFGPSLLALYGSEFTNMTPIYYLGFSAVLIAISNVIYPVLLAYNKIWIGVLINMIWGILLLFLSDYFLRFHFAEDGLALAVLISYLVMVIIQFCYCYYLIKYTPFHEI